MLYWYYSYQTRRNQIAYILTFKTFKTVKKLLMNNSLFSKVKVNQVIFF